MTMNMNLRTGELSQDGQQADAPFVEVDASLATPRQLKQMRVPIYDRSTPLGKLMTAERLRLGIKDGLNASTAGKPWRGRGAPNVDIDLGLSWLCAARQPNATFDQHEIAAVCGCSRETIRKIQESAMEKLRKHPAVQALRREVCA